MNGKSCLYDGYGVGCWYGYCTEEEFSIRGLIRVFQLFVYMDTVKRKTCLYDCYKSSRFMFTWTLCRERAIYMTVKLRVIGLYVYLHIV